MPALRLATIASAVLLSLAAGQSLPAFAQSSKAAALLKPLPPAVEAPTARLDDCPEPEWPAEAVLDLNEGSVTLSFLIDADGTRIDSRLDKSSGFPVLDHTFRSNIEKCSFNPGKKNGVPVKAWMTITYDWILDDGTPAEKKVSLERILTGAYAGKSSDQYRVGLAYFNAGGVPRDVAEAKKWMRMVADKGLPAAFETMGMMLLADPAEKSAKAEAISWYRKAAMAERPQAQYTLAKLLLKQGDTAEGMKWLRRAAKQDLASAQSALALELLRAKGAPDLAEAVSLLEAAAAKEDRVGQDALARLYEQGRGVPQDLAKAAALYTEAARGGNAQAQAALAKMLDSGKGVPQDRARAKTWQQQAAAKRPLAE